MLGNYLYLLIILIKLTIIKSNTEPATCIVFLEQQENRIFVQQFFYSLEQYQCIGKLVISNHNLLANINLSGNITLKYSGCYIVVLNKLQNQLYDSLIQETHSLLPPFAEHMNPTKIKSRNTPYINCHNDMYIHSYLRVFQYFSNKKIIILVDKNRCRNEFAYALKVRLDYSNVHLISLIQTNFAENLYYILKGRDRIFVLLTSKDIAQLVIEYVNQLNGVSNILIILDNLQNLQQTYVTINIERTDYQVYEPQRMNLRNYSLNSIPKCTAKSRHINIIFRSYHIDTWIWYNEIFKKLFRTVRKNDGVMQFTLYESEIGVGKKDKIIKLVKVITVFGGPYLSEASYLYNEATNTCEASSLKCKKYDLTTDAWSYTCCYGYMADLYELIGNILNFQIELYSVENGKYGGYNEETNAWNGMVGSLTRGDFIMAGPLTINTERLAVIDFSNPFTRVAIGIATKITKNKSPYFNWRFLGHLSTNSLIAVFGFIMVSVALICINENIVLRFLNNVKSKNKTAKISKSYSIKECLSYIAGVLFQRDIGGLNPSTSGARVIAVFCAFGMVTLVTLYTASLTVDQVTKSTSSGFQGLNDHKMRYPTSDFTFGTVTDTSTVQFFQGSPNEEYKRMYDFMLKYNVDTARDAITKLLTGELDAFLEESPYLMYEIAHQGTCKITIHQNDVGAVSFGIGLQKNSNWRLPVSEAISYLEDFGMLEKLEKKWLIYECPSSDQEEFSTFDLTFFNAPTVLLLVACILSSVILLMELYHKKYIKSRRLQYNLNKQ